MMPRAHKQKGVAVVEFAILLPLLLSITFALTEMGRAFYQYNTLLKATRDAARARSLGSDEGEARCLAVYGEPAPCSDLTPLVDGLTPGLVVFTPQSIGSINVVRVSIKDFPFVSLVPYVIPDLTFAEVSTAMRVP